MSKMFRSFKKNS